MQPTAKLIALLPAAHLAAKPWLDEPDSQVARYMAIRRMEETHREVHEAVDELRYHFRDYLPAEHRTDAERDIASAEKALNRLALVQLHFVLNGLDLDRPLADPPKLSAEAVEAARRSIGDAGFRARNAVWRIGRWGGWLAAAGWLRDSQDRETATKASKPDGPTRRLRISISGKKVLLDGKPVQLDGTAEGNEETRVYLRYLIAADGDWFSGGEIEKSERKRGQKGLTGQRWDRVKARLPQCLKKLIETHQRKGSRFTKSAWRK